jgi:hypothetical protein
MQSLLHTQMGVDVCIAGSSGQILVLTIGGIKVGLGSAYFFARPKSMTWT